MRQVDDGVDDDRLRTALANMRYAACTKEDVAFLQTRVAGLRSTDPRLDSALFRNVAIITALNSQKDVINRLGARRFAQDMNRELVSFYSIDKLSARAVDKSRWKRCEQSKASRISDRLQQRLWDAPPSSNSEHLPGKLELCLGMPMLLRSNDATELCMTKGQEASVVGWDETIGPAGQRVLETLFVHLDNLPSERTIEIPGLPPNVVPLVRTSSVITVLLEDDTLLSVVREQVTTLLNFSITDYTAQGKSRPKNPVDLTNCRDHKAYYVALSRATTAAGTIILQDFTPEKITCGMPGYLRQELRELELLDEITRLQYAGTLPRSVTGLYRRQLLRSYIRWKGNTADPVHFHPSMQSTDSERDVKQLDRSFDDYAEWGTNVSKARKHSRKDYEVEESARKKRKNDYTVGPDRLSEMIRSPEVRPVGFVWDGVDYSCGYDATLTILTNIWRENPHRWSQTFSAMGPLMQHFALMVQKAADGLITLEVARNTLRHKMHLLQPADFPYGQLGTTIDRIITILVPVNKTHAVGRHSCRVCGYLNHEELALLNPYVFAIPSNRQLRNYPTGIPMDIWLNDHLVSSVAHCPACAGQSVRTRMTVQYTIDTLPELFIVSIDKDGLKFSQTLSFDVGGVMSVLRLRGVVYGGGTHFTARYVSQSGVVWFNDGIATARDCVEEGKLDALPPDFLHYARGKKALNLIYAKV
ncbi:hypothetical protein B0H16DRAFT_1339552 [Mycena metata]|uniref:Uncharacterized protein n=1 Tax=Mycena metata TaxID=1033252 RepID=A0AAD7H9L3_9AGAR|nr:hypothetical protein B0H16DRAFT_1339552 [Mycena metata]